MGTPDTSKTPAPTRGRGETGRTGYQGRGGRLGQRNRGGRGGRFNSRHQQSGSRTTTTTFKGSPLEMNEHVYQCFGETTNRNQYNPTTEALISYSNIHLKFGSNLQLMLKNMTDTVFTIPNDPPTDASRTVTWIWEKQVDKYFKRTSSTYKQNKMTLYSVIWGQCSDAMKAKIKSVSNYEELNAKNNCLDLLLEIKGITFRFESQPYLYLALDDAKTDFYAYKQSPHESNSDYLLKFKATVNVIEHFGSNIGDNNALIKEELKTAGVDLSTIKGTDFSSVDQDTLKHATTSAKEKMCAIAFLKRADATRYC